jgi:hypothetical protein
MIRTRDLIMDGNIGAQFLNRWIVTLDLEHARVWLSALPNEPIETNHTQKKP